MTQPVATVLVLLLVALVLFATEKIPIDIVTILLVIGLVLTGTLDVSEAFAGFGNDIVITIAGLFVLTGGLVKTGVVDLVGRRLHRIAGGNEFKLTTLIMFTAAGCASVMKNTTTTAMFVPVVLGIAQRARVQPSKLLMPLAFGIIRGTKGRIAPRGEEVIQEGDLLLVQGRMEDILRVKSEAGIEIRPDFA